MIHNNQVKEVTMNENKRKAIIIDREPEAINALEGMLSPHWDITAVGSAGEATEKAANEDFDIILTGYVLPKMSGKEGILELETVTNMVAGEKAALLKKVREAVHGVEMDFQSKTTDTEELLRQSQAKQDEILELLNDQIRQVEGEKVQLAREIQTSKEEAEAALIDLGKAEKAAEKALAEKAEAERKVEAVLDEKAEAERRAETAQMEKAEAERKVETVLDEKAEAERRAEAALMEKAEAEEKVETVLNEKAEAEEKTEAARAEKAETEKKAEELSREKTKLEEAVSKLESETADLGSELNKALALAQDHLREKGEVEKKVETAINEKVEAEKRAGAALEAKAEAERRLAGFEEEAKRNNEALNMQVESLTEELNKAVSVAETIANEKTQLQQKLAQFQEHWEKHIAGE
jgi:chromosome segregation ATPase